MYFSVLDIVLNFNIKIYAFNAVYSFTSLYSQFSIYILYIYFAEYVLYNIKEFGWNILAS